MGSKPNDSSIPNTIIPPLSWFEKLDKVSYKRLGVPLFAALTSMVCDSAFVLIICLIKSFNYVKTTKSNEIR